MLNKELANVGVADSIHIHEDNLSCDEGVEIILRDCIFPALQHNKDKKYILVPYNPKGRWVLIILMVKECRIHDHKGGSEAGLFCDHNEAASEAGLFYGGDDSLQVHDHKGDCNPVDQECRITESGWLLADTKQQVVLVMEPAAIKELKLQTQENELHNKQKSIWPFPWKNTKAAMSKVPKATIVSRLELMSTRKHMVEEWDIYVLGVA